MSENDEEALLKEIRDAGLEEASMPQMMADLRVYLEQHKLSLPNYNPGSAVEASMAALDSVMRDAWEDAQEPPKRTRGAAPVGGELGLGFDDEADEAFLEQALEGSDSSSDSDAKASKGGEHHSGDTSSDSDTDSDAEGPEDSDHLPLDPRASRVSEFPQELYEQYDKPQRSLLDYDRDHFYANKVPGNLKFSVVGNEYGLIAAQNAR